MNENTNTCTLNEDNLSKANINVKSLTRLLVCIISVGILVLAFIISLILRELKSDFDANFPLPIKEVSYLSKIQNIYMNQILSENFDIKEVQKVQDLLSEYNNYLKDYTGNKSMPYQIYTKYMLPRNYTNVINLGVQKRELLDLLISYSKNISFLSKQDCIKNKPKIIEVIQKTDDLVEEILAINLKIATYQKDSVNKYQVSILKIILSSAIVIFVALILVSYLILRYISKFNTHLKKSLDSATSQLKELNLKLQDEIDAKVESIRKKDSIIYSQARLASMGEMMQNVAHQWRQPLNAIILIVQSFKIKNEQGKLNDTFINEQTKFALKIAKNMSETIDNFRNFFRVENKPEVFILQKPIKDAIELSSFMFKNLNIEIIKSLGEDVNTKGYENTISQILLVLLNNSKDALIERKVANKKIFIELSKEYECILSSNLSKEQAKNEADLFPSTNKKDEIPKVGLYLKYYDSAGGVDASIIDRICEPYFTTKHKSQGTGIGLYMVKEMLIGHLNTDLSISNYNFSYNDENYTGALFVIKL